MRRLTISLVLFGSFMPAFACADDLFLGINEIDYVSDLGKQSAPNVRSSLQLAIRPGEPFFGRAKVAGRRIVIRGTCNPGKQPDYYDVEFRVEIHTGEFVTVPGWQRPVEVKKVISSSVSTKVGEPLTLDGVRSADEANHRLTESKFVLLVATSEPEDDDPQRRNQQPVR